MFPAVLIISKQNYGIVKNKTYYKCYPDNRSGPYLVPYAIKNNFSKKLINYYVIIEIIDSVYAKIIETIGPTSSIESYNRYQLYVENLIRDKCVTEKIIDLSKLIDNTDRRVYTLDPKGTVDFDDAFSLKDLSENSEESVELLSIYITNTSYYIKEIDFKQINVSSIYFQEPGRLNVYNMFKKELVKKMSLIENGTNAVLTLDILIKNGIITDSKLYNSKVKIKQNLIYGADKNIVRKLIEICKKTFLNSSNIIDDHKMIEILMVYFNLYTGRFLSEHNTGIFRFLEKNVQNDLRKNTLHDYYGVYSTSKKIHEMFLDYKDLPYVNGLYIHSTSPIRRIVDTLNMNKITCILDLSHDILDDIDLDIINDSSRKIKKIQNRSKLLCMFQKEPNAIYEGSVIDKSENKYDILINNTIYNYSSIEIIEIGTIQNFKIFIFQDQSNFKQKIRLSII